MDNLQDSLINAIYTIANKAVKDSNNSLVVKASISKIVNTALGQYKISYLGETLSAKSLDVAKKYEEGDEVYVIIQANDLSQDILILSSLSGHNVTVMNSDINKDSSLYIYDENLFYSKLENGYSGGLISYNASERFFDFDFNYFKNIYEDRVANFNCNKFRISFSVTSGLDKNQTVTKGDYGFKLTLPVKKENEFGVIEKYVKTFVINARGYMNGNYYNYINPDKQEYIFELDLGESLDDDKNNFKISIYSDDNFNQDSTKTTEDIYFSNISFNMIKELDENDSGYILNIKATEGDYFCENISQNKKTLTPLLYVNGQIINKEDIVENSGIYDCYWFEEDSSIKENSDYYVAAAGEGWRCINNKIDDYTKEDGTIQQKFDPSIYSIDIYKEKIKSTLRYKCVVYYNPSEQYDSSTTVLLEAITTITNLNGLYTIKMSTENNRITYIKNADAAEITAELITPYLLEDNIICRWSCNPSIDDKYIIYEDPNLYNEEFSTEGSNFIYTSEANRGYSKIYLSLNEFEGDIIDVGCTFYRREDKIITAYGVDGEDKTITTFSDIKIGSSNIEIYMTEVVDNNYHITTDYDVLYKYDADGDSPASVAYDGLNGKVNYIKPITFTIYNQDGELSDAQYANCQATWKIPKDSLITLPSDIASKVVEYDDEEDDNFYIIKTKGQASIPYSINNFYSSTYAKNNTIYLSVTYLGTTLNTSITIKFMKEGENGTNGDKFAGYISYKNKAYEERNESGNPVKAVLIYNYNDKSKGWYKYFNNNLEKISDDDDDDDSSIFAILEGGADPADFEVKVYKNGSLVPKSEIYEISWSMYNVDSVNLAEGADKICLIPYENKLKIGTEIIKNAEGKNEGVKSPSINENSIYCNILQAKITINDNDKDLTSQTLFCYYPIELIITNIDYGTEELNNNYVSYITGGFNSIMLDIDGTNPKYCTDPFENTDNLVGDSLTAKFSSEGILSDDDLMSYKWTASNNIKIDKSTDNKISPVYNTNTSDTKTYIKLVTSGVNEKYLQSQIDLLKDDADDLSHDEKYYKWLLEEKEEFEIEWFNRDDESLLNEINAKNTLVNYYDKLYFYWHEYIYRALETFLPIEDDDNSILKLFNIIEEDLLSIHDEIFALGTDPIINKDYKNQFQIKDEEENYISFSTRYLEKGIYSKKNLLEILNSTTDENIKKIPISIIEYVKSNIENFYGSGDETIKNISGFIKLLKEFNLDFNEYLDLYDKIEKLTISTEDTKNEKGEVTGYKFLDTAIFTDESEQIEELLTLLDTKTENYDFSNNAIQTNIIDKIFDIIKSKSSEYKITTDYKIQIKLSGEYISKQKELQNKNISELTSTSADKDRLEQIKKYAETNPPITIHILPIPVTYNSYGMSDLNEWDGNKLYFEEGGEYLYAPKFGSGEKKNGLFRGVFMGKVDSKIGNTVNTRTGIFARGFVYNSKDTEKEENPIASVETFFLDAQTGKATFGREGKGQIVIDPSDASSALIYGGNYKDGTSGMCINLTEPSIKWGNGNFSVSKDGYLNAVNGEFNGKIKASSGFLGNEKEGWEIKSDKLSCTTLGTEYKYNYLSTITFNNKNILDYLQPPAILDFISVKLFINNETDPKEAFVCTKAEAEFTGMHPYYNYIFSLCSNEHLTFNTKQYFKTPVDYLKVYLNVETIEDYYFEISYQYDDKEIIFNTKKCDDFSEEVSYDAKEEKIDAEISKNSIILTNSSIEGDTLYISKINSQKRKDYTLLCDNGTNLWIGSTHDANTTYFPGEINLKCGGRIGFRLGNETAGRFEKSSSNGSLYLGKSGRKDSTYTKTYSGYAITSSYLEARLAQFKNEIK